MEGARLAPKLAKGPLLSPPMLPRIKQGFVGSEGTLGVVTGAVLRLAPLPTRRATAWLKLARGAPLAELLALIRRKSRTC